MSIDPAVLAEYLEALVPARPEEMVRMEATARESNFPIIGPTAGYLCYQLTRLTGARTVFELGSGYGYSTAWFAQAVRENGGGLVHHVVWDEELSGRPREHMKALGLADLVQFHVSEAVAALSGQPGPFDLIFNDIDKQGYPASLPVIHDKLRSGGLLITDNALWQGKIFQRDDKSPATEGVRELTRMLST
ncbi:MAG: O-methyltransferase, partial [Longimicrobiales bacterium]